MKRVPLIWRRRPNSRSEAAISSRLPVNSRSARSGKPFASLHGPGVVGRFRFARNGSGKSHVGDFPAVSGSLLFRPPVQEADAPFNSCGPTLRRGEAGQTLVNDLIRLRHDAVDELLHAGDVLDEANDQTATPGAAIHLAFNHDFGIDPRDLFEDIVDLETCSLFLLDRNDLFHTRVVEYSLGVAQRAHDEAVIELGCLDYGLFDIFMHRRLFGGDEAGAHVDALGTESERSYERATIGLATRGYERNGQLFRGPREQYHVGHVIFAGMAAAFEAVYTRGIAADRLGFEGVTH